jgi:signal transduction histidine kinase
MNLITTLNKKQLLMSDIASNNNLSKPYKRGFVLSIRSKMLIYFGSMFIIILTIYILSELFGVPFTTFKGEYEQHQTEVFQSLKLVADLKKDLIERWMEERRCDARVLSKSSILTSYVVSLLPIIDKSIAENARGKELSVKLKEEKTYQVLTQHLNLVKESYMVYDKIQIAYAATGTIVASTEDEDLDTDIHPHNYLAKIIHQGYKEIIDIGTDPSSGVLKLFIFRAIDLHGEDQTSAVLIMQINSEDFIKPILHTGGGMGVTGEALLISQEVKILKTLQHLLADGTTAIPLEYQITAMPAVLAAQGQEGLIETEDYRGEAVLAAYRHIRITSELGWGLVVKRDQSEVFAPLRESIFCRIIVGSFCAFLMLGLTVVIARNLARPLRRLSKAAREVEEGNFAVRTLIRSSDEVGVLASAFDSMVRQIQDWNKKLNKRVKDRTHELESKNAELERYTYTVSHDLKSPLITIKGFLGMLEKDIIKGDTERINKDMSHIHNAALKMNQLLDELLELSRVGKVVGTKKEVSLRDLANEALDLVGGQIEKQEVQVEIAPDLPVVYVDRRRLVEVFQNLIDNAVKHMDKQTELHIEIGVRQENGEDVYYVRDNGIGIEPRYHENVFGIFNKLDQTSDGTGIGLAIVKRIIEVHNGRIWIESEGEGKGTTFCFTIAKRG